MKNIKIPESFTIGPHQVNVTYKDDMQTKKGISGDCNSYFNIINLQSPKNDCPKSQIEHSFYHEKVHIILDSMGENDLSKNEKFVDTFALLLLQTDKSAKFS